MDPHPTTDFSAEERENLDIEIDLLLDAIYRKYHYDFRQYARSSIRRRLLLALQQLSLESITELQHALLHDVRFFPRLLHYLTIPTTEMFRDPTYYQALRTQVLPHLRTYPSLKIWVPGCSTGEELYSLAILFREEGLETRTMFYATDINPRSLETARRGIYPARNMALATQNYRNSGGRRSLSDYMEAGHGDQVRFDRSLLRQTVFADHSLATDQVFAEVHLISCRNVLIYFGPELQDRAIGLFRDALVREGFLGLGSKETVQFSSYAADFAPFVKEDRIFRKVA